MYCIFSPKQQLHHLYSAAPDYQHPARDIGKQSQAVAHGKKGRSVKGIHRSQPVRATRMHDGTVRSQTPISPRYSMYGIYAVRRRNHQVEGALEEASEEAEERSRWERTYSMDRSRRGSNAPFESKKATDYVRVVKDDVGGPSLQEGRGPLMRKTGERTCWPSRPGAHARSTTASETQ